MSLLHKATSLAFFPKHLIRAVCINRTYMNLSASKSSRQNKISHSSVMPHGSMDFTPKLFPIQCGIPRLSPVNSGWFNELNVEHLQMQYPKRIQLPVPSFTDIMKLPPIRDIADINNEQPKQNIEAPSINSTEKQAARLIVIRRRKMKKHKLKKLRIRMKFEWAKVRQRREMRKEKAFQAQLIAQIKEAEIFDAEKYVKGRLEKAHEFQLPQTWKGKRLPAFIIKEKLGIK